MLTTASGTAKSGSGTAVIAEHRFKRKGDRLSALEGSCPVWGWGKSLKPNSAKRRIRLRWPFYTSLRRFASASVSAYWGRDTDSRDAHRASHGFSDNELRHGPKPVIKLCFFHFFATKRDW